MNKVELTPAKLADIKKKAEAAKDVKWPTIEQFPQHEEYPAAELIAAADPATVLALVEEIEQLRRMERKWGQMLKNVKDTAPDLETFLSPDAFKINESEAGQ